MRKTIYIASFFAAAVVLASFMPKGDDGFRIRTIVIDPGHGGHDPGCLGASAREKEVALGIALKLGAFIEENMKDVKVVYTRKTDEFVELHRRAAIANEHKADLFLCIHLNSGPPTAFGAETYIMGLHKSAANLDVAKRENSSILLEDNYEEKYDGYDPKSPEGHAILELFQSAHFEQSLNLATKVQQHFRNGVKMKDRGVKQAGFLVLYRTTMPSILIESGFLTNASEEKFLASEEGQREVAAGIFKAFQEYKTEMEAKSTGVIVDRKPPPKDDRVATAGHDERTNARPEAGDSGAAAVSGTVAETGEGLVFKVQIVSSANRIPMDESNFRGLDGVIEYRDNGIYKYAAGTARSFRDATKLQAEVRAMGYADAFVVAFEDGQRIPLKEALEKSKQP